MIGMEERVEVWDGAAFTSMAGLHVHDRMRFCCFPASSVTTSNIQLCTKKLKSFFINS